MKLIIFLIYTRFVYTELHTFTTTYSGVTGIPGFPEFSAVTTLDGQQIDYYDSNINQIIPKQEWMKRFASSTNWRAYTVIREDLRLFYKTNIKIIKEDIKQSGGIHTYQRMCGCEWDDETEVSRRFDMYGYDGEDFITLNMSESRFNASVKLALPTVKKWNNDIEQLTFLQSFYKEDCVYWLKTFLGFAKDASDRAVPPEVSLLQKDTTSPVTCHVTGFYRRNSTILWRKNGQDLNNSQLVKFGKRLPNEDGTFQMAVTLYVLQKDWKKDQYICVVEHNSLIIQKILMEEEIMINESAAEIPMYAVFLGIAIIVVLLGCLYYSCNTRKKKKNAASETPGQNKSLHYNQVEGTTNTG